jgi:hypothetical protein
MSRISDLFGVSDDLVKTVEQTTGLAEGFEDLNKKKNGPNQNGPAANQQKQMKPFGGGGGEDTNQPGGGNEPGKAPGQGFPPNQQGQMFSDDAAKQMQQQQADKQRAEMEVKQQKDAEEEQERNRLKELKLTAEKEVSDDLNDKYVDQDDTVEFYPKMESFISYARKQVVKEESKEQVDPLTLEVGQRIAGGWSVFKKTKKPGVYVMTSEWGQKKEMDLRGRPVVALREASGSSFKSSLGYSTKYGGSKEPPGAKVKYVECPQCDGEGDAPYSASNATGNCPKCGGGGKIPAKK